MADTTPAKRVLPARRRESSAKRRAISPPKPVSASAHSPVVACTPTSQTAKDAPNETPKDVRVKRKYTKRASVVHISTPARSASTATSNPDEILPTKTTSSRPLPVGPEAQPGVLSSKQYQSIAESAVLAASLQRSRMQLLCDGIFKKYWTKPVRRKGVIEQPPNNPDFKSMQKLGNATITVEPHTFDITFYVVREAILPVNPVHKPYIQPSLKQSPAPDLAGPVAPPLQPTNFTPAVSNVNTPSASPLPKVSPAPSQPKIEPASPLISPMTALTGTPISTPVSIPTPAPVPTTTSTDVAIATTPISRVATPPVAPITPVAKPTPAPATKTTDPVIQMLASRAATDNNLKELMKVVATSRATPDQLKEFQAHIDEINGIVRRQEAEKPKAVKKKTPKVVPQVRLPPPVAAHPATYHDVHRNSPLGPGPGPNAHFSTYPVQPRPEPLIKHVVIEFSSTTSSSNISSDRWLFPENAVLDLVYGGTEMTCSFLAERKGSDVLAGMNNLTSEEMENTKRKWQAETVYYQPVTMVVRATQHRVIESVARSAKPLPEVQKHMQEVMETKTRAPQEFLVLQLPREKAEDFVDSAVELSNGEEEQDLLDAYPM